MRVSARPEAVAVLAEGRIKNGLQAWESSPVAPDWAGTSPTTVARGARTTPYADARPSGRCPDHPRQPRLCWPEPASTPVAGSLSSAPLPAALTLCPSVHAAGDELHRCPGHTRLHRVLPRTALLAQASDAMLATSTWPRTLPLVRPFAFGSALRPSLRLLRPRLTSRSGSTPLPFQAQGEISPGKNALLHCTAAGSTLLPP